MSALGDFVSISAFAETCPGAEISTVFFLRARRFLGSAGAGVQVEPLPLTPCSGSLAVAGGTEIDEAVGTTAERALRLISSASASAWAALSAATRALESTILPGAALGVGRLGVNIGAGATAAKSAGLVLTSTGSVTSV